MMKRLENLLLASDVHLYKAAHKNYNVLIYINQDNHEMKLNDIICYSSFD